MLNKSVVSFLEHFSSVGVWFWFGRGLVLLGKHLACYSDRVLDARQHNKVEHFEIPIDGYVLQPGILYLGVTEEYTETHEHIPLLA